MDNNTLSLEERLTKLDKEYPFVPHTNAGRLSSTVRRMKAQKEMDIPIELRSGGAISVKTRKAADEMAEQQWETFYNSMCRQLKKDYPDIYSDIFPGNK